jgi:hypothetical protein
LRGQNVNNVDRGETSYSRSYTFPLPFCILLFFSIELFTNIVWYIIVSLQYTASFYILNKAFQVIYLELVVFLTDIVTPIIRPQIVR